MKIIEEHSFEEGKILKVMVDENALNITIRKWDNQNLEISIKDYMRLYDYNCIGREINECNILDYSALLEEEKKEMESIGYCREEYMNLIHLQFTSYDDLLLLDVIANKDSISINLL